MIKAINIDVAFLSTSAWDVTHGISTPYEEKLMVKNAVLASSASSYLTAGSSKYGTYGFYSICELERFQGVLPTMALKAQSSKKYSGGN